MSEHQELDPSAWRSKQVFTTGEAAELCTLSQQTIIRCFDSGRLRGFRVPGSKSRRIPRTELLRFMRANDIPVHALEGSDRRALVIEDDSSRAQSIADALEAAGNFEVRIGETAYEGGFLAERFRPHVVILQRDIPGLDVVRVCANMRDEQELSETRIIVLARRFAAGEVERLVEFGVDDCIRLPFGVEDLMDRVARQVEV